MPVGVPGIPQMRPAGGAGRRRVLLADDRKTLFHYVVDDRIELQRAYDPHRPPHLIVLPCPKLSGAFADSARRLPIEAWRDAGVVLDASGKGAAASGKFRRRLHSFLAERAIPETRCAFITNNRRLSLRASQVRILHYDYWLRRMLRAGPEQGELQFERRHEGFRARSAVRPRRFLSFNLTARRWKLLFLLSLLRDGLWERGFISFGGFGYLEQARGGTLQTAAQDLLAAEGFQDMAAGLVGYLPELDGKGQVLFGQIPRTESGRLRKPTQGQRVEEFDQAWFSATTETEMTASVDCVTEKAFKAPMNFHPQVIFGNPGAMARLRAFGLQSFAPLIDERYDQEPDPRRRFDLAYAEILRLCALDEPAMARMEAALSETLVANARWSLVGLPAHYREVIDPQIVTSLLELCPEPAADGV